MIRVVFDTNVLVSAFLTRNHPGGVSVGLYRLVETGILDLYLSPDIIEETAATLVRSKRMQSRYSYTPIHAAQYCADLFTIAGIMTDPAQLLGAVERDPDDGKIVACAIAAHAEYVVTRDQDLLSLGNYGDVVMITPEDLLRVVRTQQNP